MDKNLKIAVVCGGNSSERKVSLDSGKAVFDALNEYGFTNVILFDLKEDNFPELIKICPDICFLALHGKGGEDGKIQGALETLGIKYTFSGVEASAVAMDKIATKKMLFASGIPTAEFAVIRKSEFENTSDAVKYAENKVGFPLVIKSPLEGSSIGVEIIKDKSGAEESFNRVFEYGNTLLAEKFLDGVEVTVPVMGNENPESLPIIEITSENEFYDYQSKYTPGMCKHIIPARISEKDSKTCSDIALKVYKELGCCGIARIDMIIDKKEGPSVMEVNTIPGMTSMSLVPDSARSKGIEFPELCARFIELSLMGR